jgi:hypothetical protein
MREPNHAGKGKKKLGRKDKRGCKIVAHMHYFAGQDQTRTYKNRHRYTSSVFTRSRAL